MSYKVFLANCIEWADQQSMNSIHSIVTDPPFGHKEYTDKEQQKLRAGRGGVWRIPPSFDGSNRKPLPRFTVLTNEDIEEMSLFFHKWASSMFRILVPGAHIFIAANPLLSQYVWFSLMSAGFDKRGEVVRVVRTFRGGDRPKGAHEEFKNVSTMPRSSWEPWGIFRKPLEGLVSDNLRKWKTGGLKRVSEETPFIDVIHSGRTPTEERAIAPHPSIKPQAFMRQIVRASLPLGEGVVLDPFMGSGATIAACEAVGYESVGIEIDPIYFEMAEKAIPKLIVINNNKVGTNPSIEVDYEAPQTNTDGGQQLRLALDKLD